MVGSGSGRKSKSWGGGCDRSSGGIGGSRGGGGSSGSSGSGWCWWRWRNAGSSGSNSWWWGSDTGGGDSRSGGGGSGGSGGSRRRSGSSTAAGSAASVGLLGNGTNNTSQGANETWVALGRSGGPAQETVGNIGGIAVSSHTITEVSARSNGTGVVDTGSLVVLADIRSTTFSKTLLQAITRGSTSDTISDHLGDLGLRAGVLHIASVVAGAGAVVILHQTWVANSVVGCWCANTAIAFLKHDGEDESSVDARGASHGLDRSRNIVSLVVRIVRHIPLRAGARHDDLVHLETKAAC